MLIKENEKLLNTLKKYEECMKKKLIKANN